MPPNPHEPDEPWLAFAVTAQALNPGDTITQQVAERLAPHARGAVEPSAGSTPPSAGSAPPRAKAAPEATRSLTLPELPYLPVATSSEAHAPLDGADAAGASAADFQVLGVLGEGGMGRVLLARQRSLQRDVAIKVVKSKAPTRAVVDTLLAEAIITGSIEHPSVVPVHALGRDADGKPVLVMKRIDGVSWRDLKRDPSHPAWATLAPDDGDRLDAHLEILMAVCNAVHLAHNRGIVHRDLKLSNVMIGGFGEVYLVDWGIAMRLPTEPAEPRETDDDGELDAMPIGTPAYMAPEMVIGDPAKIDARTDVYLLGATLHAALMGSPRHVGDTLVEVLLSARMSEPFAYGPEIPGELAAICNKATSPRPEDRFQSALEVRRAIALFRRHRGSIAQSDQATAALAAIDALAAGRASTATRADERRAHRLMTECRFGFMQALSAWKQNEAARAGLNACLARMIEHELAQRDLEGARDLYAELPEPHPALAARIDGLAAELSAARKQDERLRALERDHDISIGGRLQLPVVALMPVLGLGASFLLYMRRGRVLGTLELISAPAGAFVVMFLGLILVRRRLTAISRRALSMPLLLLAGVIVHRLFARAHGESMTMTMAFDLLIAAFWAGAMAMTLLPRASIVAVTFLLGTIGMTVWPDWATPISGVTMTSSLVIMLIVWHTSVDPKRRAPK